MNDVSQNDEHGKMVDHWQRTCKGTNPTSGVAFRGSLDLRQELLDLHAGVLQGSFEGAAVHLIVIGKDDPPSVGMFQFDVAPPSMKLDEPEALQGQQT